MPEAGVEAGELVGALAFEAGDIGMQPIHLRGQRAHERSQLMGHPGIGFERLEALGMKPLGRLRLGEIGRRAGAGDCHADEETGCRTDEEDEKGDDDRGCIHAHSQSGGTDNGARSRIPATASGTGSSGCGPGGARKVRVSGYTGGSWL
nr:hypothetical protein GCM10023233_17380 [Brevibacterium otitidis]